MSVMQNICSGAKRVDGLPMSVVVRHCADFERSRQMANMKLSIENQAGTQQHEQKMERRSGDALHKYENSLEHGIEERDQRQRSLMGRSTRDI